ncbi:hypothetical protein [Alkalicoccobacillus gibsonii]|uniref:hypothetical protein n=1 Tax=Alkalicoccobacillus gibsonii TaxID=79881 RepID=UPI0019329DFB|nr:hypothetical protein [Alkalicoccobacillus gibsonii]MBM0066859.1 hypothetical protein [Alkalicoccobacillus gibsonii]
MNKIRMVLLNLLFLLIAVGCSEQPEPDIKRGTIEGRYAKDLSGDHFIMSEEDGAIIMSNHSGEDGIFDGLSSGDLIHITVEVILESYPAKTSIYELEFVEEGTEEDLPQDELDTLHELGWTFE